tara:strand:+ start:319 stop:924 length:606 start_codon:yes stop_codon:yes gene_type:complete
MIIIKHRVNTSIQLKKLSKIYGVEIDLRSSAKDIYLHHDPFKKGELFSNWVKNFNHKLIVLNVKEEGLENKTLEILKKNKITNFFFHDQTFSSLLKNRHKTKVSLRFSEYENLKKTNELFNQIKWLWIDNFTEFKLEKNFYLFLKKKKVKICLVSPELVNKNRVKEIKELISYLKKNKFNIDAVCTKKTDIWMKFISKNEH